VVAMPAGVLVNSRNVYIWAAMVVMVNLSAETSDKLPELWYFLASARIAC
jgi:hypothetical protein